MSKKKILILTAKFGAGHTSVSQAIKKHLLEKNNNYDITITDFVEVSVPELNEPMVRCYEYQTKNMPIIYNTYYYAKKIIKSKYDTSYKIYLENLEKYLREEDPDLIISTFPHASACVSKIKESGDFNKTLITVITDVVVSHEWIHENTNFYFVPTQYIKEKLVKKGINESSIKVTGVPVDKKFVNDKPKDFSKKKRIMLMGGGRGLFDMSESFFYWLDSFIAKNNNIEATIITGTNEKLLNKLAKEKPLKNIKVHGFTSDMHSKLKEHNVLITKAGGATLFESINAGIPVIVKKPSVGQEIANAKFINREKVGYVYSKDRELKKLIKKMSNKNFNFELDNIASNIHSFKNQLEFDQIHEYVKDALMIDNSTLKYSNPSSILRKIKPSKK